MNHTGLNQLLCAAIVNGSFRDKLLQEPEKALAAGYFEHRFRLTPEERDLVLSIQAEALEDFAAQIHSWLSSNGGGNGMGPHRAGGVNGRNGNGNGKRSQKAISVDEMLEVYPSSSRVCVGAVELA